MVIWTLIVLPLLPFAAAAAKEAWDTKESVEAHKGDLRQIDGKLDRALDVLCEMKPKARACK